MDWFTIDEFPRYSINKLGEVLDTKHESIINPHQVTGGALAVRLRNEDDRCFYTRSVKVLVAQKFVDIDFDPEYMDLEGFDTPILLDNNPLNVSAENIRWRPRWFAWEYTHQFKDLQNWYYEGPLKSFQTNEVFRDVAAVGMRYGLLFKAVYDAANEFEDGIPVDAFLRSNSDIPAPVWPTRGCFGWNR